jgi:hypothetical protein
MDLNAWIHISLRVRFCSAVVEQAYGAKQYALVGTILQRSLLMCLVTFAALQVLWAYMGPVLLWAGAFLLFDAGFSPKQLW